MERYKYPKTPLVSWSHKVTSDDVFHTSMSRFEHLEVVVTEKLDGECLSGETIVYTNLGEKRLDDICNNEYPDITVLSFNEEDNSISYKKILNYFTKNNNNDWYEIETENGNSIILTGNHRVWLPKLNCYRKVEDLNGDEEFLLIEKEDLDQVSL